MSATKVSSSRGPLVRPTMRQLALASAALAGVGTAVIPARPAAAHEHYHSIVDAFGGTRGGVSAAHDWVGVCHQGSGYGFINFRTASGGSGILEVYGNCDGHFTSSRVTRFQVCDVRIGACTAWKTA